MTADREDAALYEVWVLGNRLRIPVLQNAALEAIHLIAMNARFGSPSMKHFHYIYESTLPGSPLRRYYVKIAAHTMDSGLVDSCPGYFPHQMLIGIVSYMLSSSMKIKNQGPEGSRMVENVAFYSKLKLRDFLDEQD